MNNGFQALGRQKSLFVLAVSGLLLHILLACSGTMQCNVLFLLNGKISAFQLLKKMSALSSASDEAFLNILSLVLAAALVLVGLSAVISALPILLDRQYKRRYLVAAAVALPLSAACQAVFYRVIKGTCQDILGDVIQLSGSGVLYFLESAAAWIFIIALFIGLKHLTKAQQNLKSEEMLI